VIATITPFDAEDFRRHLRTTMAESTTRKVCSRAKTMFAAAVKQKVLTESPFADMKNLAIRSAKKAFVSREDADKVLEACIDNQWRLIFVLCRYGGLRCPSEVLRLRWGDIHWAQNRITVHSPKTERYEGKESRVIPIFPEILPELQAVWNEAADGTEFIITRYRKSSTNLRTQLERTIIAAGLKRWPVLFNSLRATRATELHDHFPGHVVHEWLGHSERIAERHYLQVTDDHFAAASAPLESEPSAPPTPKSAPPRSKNCATPVHSPVRTRPDRSGAGVAHREIVEKRDTSKSATPSSAPPVGS
jgi:integrase